VLVRQHMRHHTIGFSSEFRGYRNLTHRVEVLDYHRDIPAEDNGKQIVQIEQRRCSLSNGFHVDAGVIMRPVPIFSISFTDFRTKYVHFLINHTMKISRFEAGELYVVSSGSHPSTFYHRICTVLPRLLYPERRVLQGFFPRCSTEVPA